MRLIFLLIIIFLNPYTIIGPLAYYAALPLFFLGVIRGKNVLNLNILVLFLFCVTISSYGVLSSALHGITQFGHIKVALSIFIYYVLGIGIYELFKRNEISINEILLATVYVGLLNSVIIILEVLNPEFRNLVESIFIESGNRDWTEGFRYRGLASGGGASLSVLVTFFIYISLYLYGKNKISLFFTIFLVLIFIASLLFIGRTGLVLIPLVFIMFFATKRSSDLRKTYILILSFLFIIYVGFEYAKSYVIEEHGEGFYDYSLGIFLEESDGFKNEGTLKVILGFLSVLPTSFPEVLIGHGFYGEGYFYPWTDSGYSRMFLSVGYFFGALFYSCIFWIFYISTHSKKSLFLPFFFILLIGEAKEGMLLAGYASRVLFVLLGFWAASKFNSKTKKFV